MLNLLLLGISLCAGASISAADFYAYWGDGKAELSSYRVVQPRYGELREGYGVMIFVTEDIHPQTYIKLDAPRANSDRLYALKLNHVLKFATGLYDYSVMTFLVTILIRLFYIGFAIVVSLHWRVHTWESRPYSV